MHVLLNSVSARPVRRKRGARVTAFALFCALTLAGGAAVAQVATPEAPPAASSEHLEDAGCVKDEEVSQNTNELFHRALVAWEAGDTDAAVGALRQAHAISSCLAFLFILGELQLEQQRDCEALSWYERYLHDNPGGEKSAPARQRVAELRPRCTSVAPVPEAPSQSPAAPSEPLKARVQTAPPPAPKYWTAARVGGWSSIGVSAMLAVGTVFYAVRAENAENDYEQLWTAAANDPAWRAEWQQQHSDLEQRGTSSATTARILGGAAAALAVGGTLLVVLNPGAEPSRTHDVALSVQPQELRARYSFRF